MDVKLKRLINDLENKDEDLRALSAMTLMKIDVPDKKDRDTLLNVLINATTDENVAVRFFVHKAIDKIRKTDKMLKVGEVNTVPIDTRLESENFKDRLSAVMEIKEGKLPDYKEKLLSMLNVEQHSFVKAGIISCLSLFLTKEEAHVLSPFLTDPDNRVRSNTIEAIEYIKADEAIPALFSSLHDPDNRVRAVAATALQSFGEEKVFVELKKMLDSPEEWMKVSAIHSLSHIQAGEAITLLISASEKASNPETKSKAVTALANYNDSVAYNYLVSLKKSKDAEVKEIGIRALKAFSDKYGNIVPDSTIVEVAETVETKVEKTSSKNQDITAVVSQLFNKGKEEAIELSNRAALKFSIEDIEHELEEHYKAVGSGMFDLYQAGEFEIKEMIYLGNEILKMNFFIQKYSEKEAHETAKAKEGGFLAQLKKLFMPAPEVKSRAGSVKKFTENRDKFLIKLGRVALKKYEAGLFKADGLDQQYETYKKMMNRLEEHKIKLAASDKKSDE